MKGHFQIRKLSFEEILPVWREHLWKGERSPIETHSAIVFRSLPYDYDTRYFAEPVTYFGAFDSTTLLGVNSGHATFGVYRSRGLFVFPEHRGRGVGGALLAATIQQGLAEGKSSCWSIPRLDAWPTYAKQGFQQVTPWFSTESSDQNCYARAGFRELGLI